MLWPDYSSGSTMATGHVCQLAQFRAVLRLLKTTLGMNGPKKDPGTGAVSVTTFHYCTEYFSQGRKIWQVKKSGVL